MTGRASWRAVFDTYPCPTCGAEPGEPCTTTTGRLADIPHADRTRAASRCPRCGTITEATDPGALCPRCALVRSLEIERSTTWKRQDPD
jgi:DNA-directed RNA polymerase subunit RPC12/RpoP